MIKLGATYADKITGFKGVATGYVKYLTGCNQVLLVPKCDEKGAKVSAEWFDVQRVAKTNDAVVKLDNSKTPGFDAPAPIR